ncbi:hypothetical protein M885DRAFT_520975 [Pelagophyceae sp. CCMP2097]|nr:hypothetical protein M885DRAFT_520975 [Pelagophyceae sp. CCMP2097]
MSSRRERSLVVAATCGTRTSICLVGSRGAHTFNFATFQQLILYCSCPPTESVRADAAMIDFTEGATPVKHKVPPRKKARAKRTTSVAFGVREIYVDRQLTGVESITPMKLSPGRIKSKGGLLRRLSRLRGKDGGKGGKENAGARAPADAGQGRALRQAVSTPSKFKRDAAPEDAPEDALDDDDDDAEYASDDGDDASETDEEPREEPHEEPEDPGDAPWRPAVLGMDALETTPLKQRYDAMVAAIRRVADDDAAAAAAATGTGPAHKLHFDEANEADGPVYDLGELLCEAEGAEQGAAVCAEVAVAVERPPPLYDAPRDVKGAPAVADSPERPAKLLLAYSQLQSSRDSLAELYPHARRSDFYDEPDFGCGHASCGADIFFADDDEPEEAACTACTIS